MKKGLLSASYSTLSSNSTSNTSISSSSYFSIQSITSSASLPSLATNISRNSKSLEMNDFVNSTPIARRGLLNPFGYATLASKLPDDFVEEEEVIEEDIPPLPVGEVDIFSHKASTSRHSMSKSKRSGASRRRAGIVDETSEIAKLEELFDKEDQTNDKLKFSISGFKSEVKRRKKEKSKKKREQSNADMVLSAEEKTTLAGESRSRTKILMSVAESSAVRRTKRVVQQEDDDDEIPSIQGDEFSEEGNHSNRQSRTSSEAIDDSFISGSLMDPSLSMGGSVDSLPLITGTFREEHLKDQYFGTTSKDLFNQKFHQAKWQQERFLKDEDLTDELKTPRSLYLRAISQKNLLPLPSILRRDSKPNGVFLAHRGLGDERMLPLVKVLDILPSMEILDVCDNRLTDISLMPLSQKIAALPCLTHLDLSFNKIDDSSETIMAYLTSPLCKLRVLMLNGADVDDDESINIFKAITKHRTIHTLGLNNNLIGKSIKLNTSNNNHKTTTTTTTTTNNNVPKPIPQQQQLSTLPSISTSNSNSNISPKKEGGGDENEIDFTYGMAIRDMLMSNHILTELDLSWNSIRNQDAVEVGRALRYNKGLKKLNLANNSFGDMGTQMIGASLKKNKHLKELDLSNNAMTVRSAIVLVHGLTQNFSLEKLILDGNTLGRLGAQMLVGAIQRLSELTENRIFDVYFNNCDLRKEVPGLFTPLSPAGDWVLDLSEPYGKMVAEECMFLANYRAGCAIDNLVHNDKVIKLERSRVKSEGTVFNMDKFYEASVNASKELLIGNIIKATTHLSSILGQFEFQMDEFKMLDVLNQVKKAWIAKGKGNENKPDDLQEVFLYEVFHALFVLNDSDNSGSMETNEFLKMLESLGRPGVDEDQAQRLMGDYDRDGSGSIEAREFSMIMVNEFCRTDIVPRQEVVDKATGRAWKIPDSGPCRITMSYECDAPSVYDTVDNKGVTNIIKAIKQAKTLEEKLIIFHHVTSSPYYFLSAEQAQMIFDEFRKLHQPVMTILQTLLPQIINEEHCIKFLDFNLNSMGKLALRVQLGQLYNAYLGLPSGHYSVDLKINDIRQGVLRLSGLAAAESKQLKLCRINTSQKGNGSNFRNEFFGNSPVTMDAVWFANSPQSGSIRFDYVSTKRPREGTAPMSDSRFDRFYQHLVDRKKEDVQYVFNELGKGDPYIIGLIKSEISDYLNVSDSRVEYFPHLVAERTKRRASENQEEEESTPSLLSPSSTSSSSSSKSGKKLNLPPINKSGKFTGNRNQRKSVFIPSGMGSGLEALTGGTLGGGAGLGNSSSKRLSFLVPSLETTEGEEVVSEEEEDDDSNENSAANTGRDKGSARKIEDHEDEEEEVDTDSFDITAKNNKIGGKISSAKSFVSTSSSFSTSSSTKSASSTSSTPSSRNPTRESISVLSRFVDVKALFDGNNFVAPPLTLKVVKDQFLEQVNSSFHYCSIYPDEKLNKDKENSRMEGGMGGTSSGGAEKERPGTPPELKSDPLSRKMPAFYPLAYRLLLEIEVEMPMIYLSLDQVVELMKLFPPKESYLRVQLLVSVFSHIVDLTDLHIVLNKVFSKDELFEAYHRLGMLNLFDPMSPDRFYALDLRRWDHRETCKLLIELAEEEPGENWINQIYRWDKYDEPVPGWVLPSTWATPDTDAFGSGGPRKHGWLFLTYTSKGSGCAPVWDFRKHLRKKVLVGMKRIL